MRKATRRCTDRLFVSIKNRKGQSTVEYFLLISVLVMALYWVVVRSGTFSDPVQEGMESMQNGVSTWVEEGVVGGG